MPAKQDHDNRDAAASSGWGCDQHDADRSPAPTPTPTLSTEQREVGRAKAWDAGFRLGVSRRYNARLAAHYAGLANLATVTSLVGGSMAFANAVGGVSGAPIAASLAVALASAFSLVFRWADKARSHTDLYRQYTRLQERLVRAGDQPEPSIVHEVLADFLLVEESEPAPKAALIVLCQAEEARSLGAQPDPRLNLRWWQRWAAPFITLPPKGWEK